MATIAVKDANGATQSIEVPLASENNTLLTTISTAAGAPGDSAWASGSGSLVALLKAIATNAVSTAASPVELGPFVAKEIAASQTNAVLGATGAIGDYIQHIIIQPTTVSAGVVTLYDGSTSGTNATVYSFPGGASSLSNLAPIIIGITAKCVNAGWHVTTGTGVSVTAIGSFT